MTYKGTVGSSSATAGTSLPTTGVSIGDTYKVDKDDVTLADSSCRKGDLLIATAKAGTSEGSDGTLASRDIVWTRIESGEAADTTYTLSAASNKITLTPKTGSTTGAAQNITLKDDDIVTLTSTGNEITANHAKQGPTSGASVGTNSTTSLTHGGTFKVPALTVNEYGHVTAASDTTLTLPADQNTTYILDGDASNKKVMLKGYNGSTAAGTAGTIQFANGTATVATVTNTDNAAGDTVNVKFDHADVTCTHTDNSGTSSTAVAPGYGGTFNAITGVTVNGQGHVTAYTTSKIQIPASDNTTYTVDGAVAALTVTNGSGVKITDTLTGKTGTVSAGSTSSVVGVTSTSLTLATQTAGSGEDARYSIDLVWGTF